MKSLLSLLASLALTVPAAAQPLSATPRPALGFDELVARLSAPELPARKAAIVSLGEGKDLRAVPPLGAVLTDPGQPAEARAAAATALGHFANWRSVPFLSRGLQDPAREVRFASAIALGKAKGRESAESLASTLSDEKDWWVRFAAAASLGDSGEPAALRALSKAADAEKEWPVRLQAIRSLGKVGSRQAVYALGAPLKDNDPAVRAAAAAALGGIGGLDSINLITTALKDEPHEVPRRAMADALNRLLKGGLLGR